MLVYQRTMITLWMCIFALCIAPEVINGNPDRIKLKDIDVLTLYQGYYTAARRSHPVLQLQCTGGTAGCSAFVPRVVQCYNRGSDGYDVQWECKTDMDNAFRFGQIAVNCEGYDYPDDPYVLRGSCGLEYQLDLTLEGYQHQKPDTQYSKDSQPIMASIASLIIFVIALIVIGSVFYACFSQSQSHQRYDPPPPYPGDRVPPTAPPPPGFRSEYMPSSAEAHYSNPPYYQPSSEFQQPSGAHSSTGNTGGGFWTGAATGGFLGYLFGSSNQNRRNYYADSPPPCQPRSSWWSSSNANSPPHQATNTWWSSSGANTGSNWGSSGGTSSESSGTRTASGFGGTRRR